MPTVEAAQPGDRRSFTIGDWLVRPSQNLLERDGERTHLRPKLMDVLVVLAAGDGEVVAGEAIQGAVWGKRFLARSALSGAVCELREVLGDDPLAPRYIETVAKRGYRLVAPVGPVAPDESLTGRPPSRRLALRPRAVAVSLVTVFAVVAAVALALGWLGSGPPAEMPRLVVLPFENLGTDDDAYFAAGITEEITNRLTRLGALAVISSESARVYRGQAVDYGEIARELRVDFALQGTVRWDRNPGRAQYLRVGARLVRTRDGEVLWAEEHDGSLHDTLAMQTDIARKIVAALDLALHGSDGDELLAETIATPEAYDAYLQGMYHGWSSETEESLRRAVILLERSVELDPGFAVGWADLARLHGLVYARGYDRSAARMASQRAALARAIELAPRSAAVRFAQLSSLFVLENDFPRLLAELDRIGKNDLRSSALLCLRGQALRRLGRAHEAIPALEAALDLSPHEWSLLSDIAALRTGLGDFRKSHLDCQRLLEMAPAHAFGYFAGALNTLLWTRSWAAARTEIDRLGRFSSPGVIVWRWWFDIAGGEWEAALRRTAELPERGSAGPTGLYPRALLEGETLDLLDRHGPAMAAFERAREPLESRLADDPADPRAYAALGVVYAGLGRHDDAVRAAGRATELCPIEKDHSYGTNYLQALARAHMSAGNLALAMDDLERLTMSPLYVGTIIRISLDPRWRALHAHPRFERLLERASAVASRSPR